MPTLPTNPSPPLHQPAFSSTPPTPSNLPNTAATREPIDLATLQHQILCNMMQEADRIYPALISAIQQLYPQPKVAPNPPPTPCETLPDPDQSNHSTATPTPSTIRKPPTTLSMMEWLPLNNQCGNQAHLDALPKPPALTTTFLPQPYLSLMEWLINNTCANTTLWMPDLISKHCTTHWTMEQSQLHNLCYLVTGTFPWPVIILRAATNPLGACHANCSCFPNEATCFPWRATYRHHQKNNLPAPQMPGFLPITCGLHKCGAHNQSTLSLQCP